MNKPNLQKEETEEPERDAKPMRNGLLKRHWTSIYTKQNGWVGEAVGRSGWGGVK